MNYHIFSLFQKLEIVRKIVKNQKLTPLLFGRIFPPKIFDVISPKNHSNHCKTNFYAINFHIFSLFRKLEFGRKIVKNERFWSNFSTLNFGRYFTQKPLKSLWNWVLCNKLSYFRLISKVGNWSKNRQKPTVFDDFWTNFKFRNNLRIWKISQKKLVWRSFQSF